MCLAAELAGEGIGRGGFLRALLGDAEVAGDLEGWSALDGAPSRHRIAMALLALGRRPSLAPVQALCRTTWPVETRRILDGLGRIKAPDGFLLCHWCGSAECEAKIQEETKATIRCLAFDQPEESGSCIKCGEPSNKRAHFAKAY